MSVQDEKTRKFIVDTPRASHCRRQEADNVIVSTSRGKQELRAGVRLDINLLLFIELIRHLGTPRPVHGKNARKTLSGRWRLQQRASASRSPPGAVDYPRVQRLAHSWYCATGRDPRAKVSGN